MCNEVQRWDAFISHASEDKEAFVRPLATALQALGARVWYDEFSLKIGDSLSESIDQGLANSNYGVVILSPSFISKAWPKRELRGLTAREIGGHSQILPVWHQIGYAEVSNYSPPLADKFAVTTSGQTADRIALQILSVISPEIYGRRPYEELKSIAAGDAFTALENELKAVKSRLVEFVCEYCGSDLVETANVPLDDNHKHGGQMRVFACGHRETEGATEHMCPTDHRFPGIDDFYYHVISSGRGDLKADYICYPQPKTRFARMVNLGSHHGATREDAIERAKRTFADLRASRL